MKKSFPFFCQRESADCGPSCLRMISNYYGRDYSSEMLRKHSFISREGVSMPGISDAAEWWRLRRSSDVKISPHEVRNIVKVVKKSEQTLFCSLFFITLHHAENHYHHNPTTLPCFSRLQRSSTDVGPVGGTGTAESS